MRKLYTNPNYDDPVEYLAPPQSKAVNPVERVTVFTVRVTITIAHGISVFAIYDSEGDRG